MQQKAYSPIVVTSFGNVVPQQPKTISFVAVSITALHSFLESNTGFSESTTTYFNVLQPDTISESSG